MLWSYGESCGNVVIADHTNRSITTCIGRIISVTERSRLQQFDFNLEESDQCVKLELRC
jgi:hypothetical protein